MTTVPSTRACSRKNRVYVFREFLLETYGTYYLSKDAVVLDVAGGKGDLSWWLRNVDGCQSVVVDPRPTQHEHILRSIQYLRQHPEEAALRAVRHKPTHQPLATLLPLLPTDDDDDHDFHAPQHFPIWMDGELLEAVRAAREGQQHEWELYWTRAIARNHKEFSQNPQKNNVTDPKQAWEIFEKCKLIVAFHPDQATDFCFELAAVLEIPFCIVPCCVFPAQFPHRRLADGSRVRDYQSLLLYLTQQYPFSKQERLAFHETATARNIALYTLPPQQGRKRDRTTHDHNNMSITSQIYCQPITIISE